MFQTDPEKIALNALFEVSKTMFDLALKANDSAPPF